MSKHVSYRYDFEVIVAGVLKLISDKELLKKYKKFLDPEWFYYKDASDDRVALRGLIELVLTECEKNIDGITTESIDARIPIAIIDEKKKNLILGSYRAWRADERIIKCMADASLFDVFLNYLKILEIAKVTKTFSDKYQTGDVVEAMNIMSDAFKSANDIGHAKIERLSSKDINEALKVDAKYTETALFPFSDPQGTEMHPIDKLIGGGFQRQTLNVFISVTGGGKSMLSHHLIEACIRRKKKVWVACLEDNKKSFIFKLIANMAGININILRKGVNNLSSDITNNIERAILEINKYLEVQFIYGKSIDEIHQMALEYDAQCLMNNEPIPYVNIVDYTGHAATKSSGEKTYEKMRNAYGARKDFALTNDKICFDFAQVNREGVKNLHADKDLTQADLAGAFDLSHVCDNIISINRGPMDLSNDTCRFHIGKARDGVNNITVRVKTNFAQASYDMNNWEFMNNTSKAIIDEYGNGRSKNN